MSGIKAFREATFVANVVFSLYQTSLEPVHELAARREPTQVERAQPPEQVEPPRVQEGLEHAFQKKKDDEEALARSEEQKEALATEEIAKEYAAKENELRANQEAEKEGLGETLAKGKETLETNLEKNGNDLPQEFRDEHLRNYDAMANAELARMDSKHGAEIETLHAQRQQEIDRVQSPQLPPPAAPPPPEDPYREF